MSRHPIPIAAVVIAALVLTTVLLVAARPPGSNDPAADLSSRVLAAGDIGECGRDEQEATAELLGRLPGTILTLGDHAYDNGTPREFANCYDPSWGRYKDRTRPTRGNHDGPGYFTYFGPVAGNATQAYYAFEVGPWQVISLDSTCGPDGDCGPDSAQVRWLREQLAADESACTLAYFHHPRFSSGRHGSDERFDAFWDALHEGGADVVVNGHDHHYERFAPLTPDGTVDLETGIRQFVVGTGGANLRAIETIVEGSEVRETDSHGVLQLQLEADGYRWRFVSIAGDAFVDEGADTCH